MREIFQTQWISSGGVSPMRRRQAFIAGLFGGAVMSAVLWMARAFLGVPTDLAMIWGTFSLPKGPSAWVLGFIVHLIVSGLIALIYAWGFEHVTHRAGMWTGILFSLVHSVIAGFAFGALPAIHPRIPDAMQAPGPFLSNMGAIGVVGMFVVHAIYGAVVGAMYHPVHAGAENMRARPSVA